VDISMAEVPVSRLDTVIEWLMIALLAFMPLAFGAVETWSEMAVIALAGAMALLLALKLTLRRDASLVASWVYVPVAAFLLLVLVQLLPLPAGWVAAASPNTAALKTALLGDLSSAGDVLRNMTLTFYPLATAHDLRLVLVAAVVFVVVLSVYRRSEQIKRLLGAIAIIGGAIALLALAQDLLGSGEIYWLVPTVGDKAHSGTFVNHSHFGQFMNLSIGAALGLLLVKLHEGFQGREITLPGVLERLGERDQRAVWYLAGMIVLGAAAMFVSLTRGGMISMLIAGGFTALMIALKRALRGNGWIMTLMALGAFICVLYVGFDAVYSRLATLHELHEYEGRGQILKDIWVSAWKFPAVGTGLGTHAVVYPMFDRSTATALASHAENEYAQAVEETGIVGLAMLLAFLGIAWANYARCVRHVSLPIRSAALGLGFGLLAIMIHSLSDFGQHLPANASLTAVSCGLLVGLGRMGQSRTRGERRGWLSAVARFRPLRAAAVLGVAAVWAWALVGADAARRAEAPWKEALLVEKRLAEDGWLGTNEDYAALLHHAGAAAECEPGNVTYRYWLNVYRWRSISRVSDPKTGAIVMTPQTLAFAERVVEELHQARTVCPTFGPAYCVAGQIEKFVLDRPDGAEHIRTGFALAPCDPTACFIAGLLEVQEGRSDASAEKFQRAVLLDGGLFEDIASIYIHQANRPDLALALAAGDTSRLLHVAGLLNGLAEHQELAARARAEAIALLKERCEKPDAPAGALASVASLYSQEKNYQASADYYRRALALDYGQVGWRFSLAQALARMGRAEEAMHEARICLRLRPQMGAAEKLIADLSVHPDSLTEK
jgi:O-antigen ligase